MATRWFVFWIACWIVSQIKEDGYDLIYIILAALTTAPDIKKYLERIINDRNN